MNIKFNFQNIKAQGSTEYLVILGLVLILGLVSVSLLSSAVEDSQDAKVTQSQALLSSSTPIAITNIIARTGESVLHMDKNTTGLFMELENRGQYPITITKVLANGQEIEYLWGWNEINFTLIRQLYNKITPGENFIWGLSLNNGQIQKNIQEEILILEIIILLVYHLSHLLFLLELLIRPAHSPSI